MILTDGPGIAVIHALGLTCVCNDGGAVVRTSDSIERTKVQILLCVGQFRSFYVDCFHSSR